MSEFPFKNLIFQGGGIRTFAYHGVIRKLDERGILDQIERVGGTSAGAMLAAILSFRLGVEESIAIYNTLDYTKIPGLKTQVRMPSRLIGTVRSKEMAGNVDGLNRLLRHYGWYDTSYAYKWLLTTIAAQTGYGTATFADFRKRGFRDLYIVATNISRHQLEVFSAENTPDVAVADALLLSQSIPLFFAAPRFDGKRLSDDEGEFYGDGAILSDFPLHLFDQPPYLPEKESSSNSVNWETLGVRHFTPDDCPDAGKREINNISSYITNLFETWMDAQAQAHNQQTLDQLRTIEVSNCCISATDFHIRPTPLDESYQKLVAAGKTAVTHYLDTYTPPTADEHTLYDYVRENMRRVFNKKQPLKSS
jgi:NTE family protein